MKEKIRQKAKSKQLKREYKQKQKHERNKKRYIKKHLEEQERVQYVEMAENNENTRSTFNKSAFGTLTSLNNTHIKPTKKSVLENFDVNAWNKQ